VGEVVKRDGYFPFVGFPMPLTCEDAIRILGDNNYLGEFDVAIRLLKQAEKDQLAANHAAFEKWQNTPAPADWLDKILNAGDEPRRMTHWVCPGCGSTQDHDATSAWCVRGDCGQEMRPSEDREP
jgi:hypothetical protein